MKRGAPLEKKQKLSETEQGEREFVEVGDPLERTRTEVAEAKVFYYYYYFFFSNFLLT